MALMPRPHRNWLISWVVLGLFMQACQRSSDSPEPVEAELVVSTTTPFTADWARVGDLVLSQSEDVIISEQHYGVDVSPTGELMITDSSEGNLKIYGRDGELRAVVGEPGHEPGQLIGPLKARYSPSGTIVVYSRGSRTLAGFSPLGDVLFETPIPPQIQRIAEMMPVDDDLFLFAARVVEVDPPPRWRVRLGLDPYPAPPGGVLGVDLICVDREGSIVSRTGTIPLSAARFFSDYPFAGGPWMGLRFGGTGDGWVLAHSLDLQIIRGRGCGERHTVERLVSDQFDRIGEDIDIQWYYEFSPVTQEGRDTLRGRFHRGHRVGYPVVLGDTVLLPIHRGYYTQSLDAHLLKMGIDGDPSLQWLSAPVVLGIYGDTLFTLEDPIPSRLRLGKWVRR